MLYIYRVENDLGEGCYWFKDTGKVLSNHFTEEGYPLHPTPLEDIGIERTPEIEEVCGFLNLKQAKNWFTDEELKELKELGFHLKKVKVKKITAKGNKQVLAIR